MTHVKKFTAGTAVALAVALAGYGAALAQDAPATGQQPGAGQQELAPEGAGPGGACPEVLQGAKVTAEQVKGGVALEFTTPQQGQVKALRQQLREAAQMFEEQSKAAQAPQGEGQPADPHQIPPIDISVNNIESGVRVTVRAERPADVPELRQMAQGFEQFWATSECAQGAPGQGQPQTGQG